MFPSLKRKGTNAPRRVAVDRENSPSLRWINLQAGRLHTCRLKSWHTGRVSSNWKKMCQIILLRTPRDRSRAISYKEKEEGERKKKKNKLSPVSPIRITLLHSHAPIHAFHATKSEDKTVLSFSPTITRTCSFWKIFTLDTHIQTHFSVRAYSRYITCSKKSDRIRILINCYWCANNRLIIQINVV